MGHTTPAETRAKIGKANTGRKRSPDSSFAPKGPPKMRRKLGLASAVLFALTISATADETGTARPAGAGPNFFKITIQESDTK